MGKRTVPKNYRNVTGIKASIKSSNAQFESTLERDFLTFLEFNPLVKLFDVQPVTIHWTDTTGKDRFYTPDALVYFNESGNNSFQRKPVLYEVKYRSDLKKDWKILRPKFKAAIKYANRHGWKFKIFTEEEIRTTYTDNAKFLLPYMHRDLNSPYSLLIRRKLKELRETTVEALITSIFSDKWSQAELIPTVWQLIAQQKIEVDFHLPLTMSSKIWSK